MDTTLYTFFALFIALFAVGIPLVGVRVIEHKTR